MTTPARRYNVTLRNPHGFHGKNLEGRSVLAYDARDAVYQTRLWLRSSGLAYEIVGVTPEKPEGTE